jgi:hypothetical protein
MVLTLRKQVHQQQQSGIYITAACDTGSFYCQLFLQKGPTRHTERKTKIQIPGTKKIETVN